jgi:hypothetical protein
MSVVDDSFGHSMKPEERAVMPLAGGLMGYGYQCGMLWGAALAAGAQAYRLYGAGAQAEAQAVAAAQRLVKAFQSRAKHIDCSEITELNWQKASQGQGPGQILKFFLKGGPIVCFSMTADYARIAFSEIHAALEEPAIEAPPPPLSCAALLAQKMGAPEMHQVMAAGFAGGIGLSGSACGALGAAIWLLGMDGDQAEVKTDGPGDLFNNPKAVALVERYLKSTDYRFECAEIVGRRFENVADHAAYLRQGGCAEIIESVAAI